MEKMGDFVQERRASRSAPPERDRRSKDRMGMVASQPSPSHVSLHQRTLTPVFVDTQLSSTTAPSTPLRAHPLTLHEYKKNQQVSIPPIGGPAKRVKRKPATPNLTAVDRVAARQPQNPSPTREHSLDLSPSPWPSERVHGPATAGFDPLAALRGEDSTLSFTSLLESYYDRSNSAPPLFFDLDDSFKSIYSGESLISPAKGRIRYLKPSKRLPRPSRFSHQSITPSPLRLASSRYTNHLISPPPDVNNTSSFAVSNFSFPRPPSPIHAASFPDESVPAIESDAPKISTDRPEPSTPTTLHFRGVSFDVVNPHNSLDLRNIETPADRDADVSDYFETNSEAAGGFRSHKRDNLSNRTMESRQTFRTANEHNSPNSRSGSGRNMTPPRAVYNDLPSAYQAITSRSGLSTSRKSSRLELPLPPQPVAVSPHKSFKTQMSNSSSNLSSFRPEPLKVQKANASPSVLRRVTSIFRRGKPVEDEESKGSTSGSQLIALVDNQPASPPRRAPSIHLQWFQKLGHDKRTSRSAPYFSGSTTHGTRTPGHVPRHSISQPDIRHSAYVSNYPDTEAAESRIFDTGSIAPDWSSPDLDYSQEVYDQSNPWQFADKPGTEAQRMSLLREGATENILDRYTQNDTTLDSIVGHYYKDAPPGSAPSLTTLSTAGEELDSSPLIERGRHGGNSRDHNLSSSGLSQFDFGLNYGNSGSDSDEELQETPSRLSGLRSLRASASRPPSGPPSEPLPFLPSLDLQPPNPPFMRREHSSVTEHGTSCGSSYGDTRNLLLISSSTQRHCDVTPESKLGSLLPSESAKASSTTLPANFHENEHGQKNTDEQVSQGPQATGEVSSQHRSLQASLEKDIEDEARRYSRMSGISNLSGSLFVLKNANRQNSTLRQESQTGLSNNPLLMPQHFTPAIPKMWQEQSSTSLKHQSGSKEESDYLPSSYVETRVSDDQDDWETVGDASRGDIALDDMEDTSAIISEFGGGSYTVPAQAQVQPSDESHSHRKPSASILLPTYDFRGGVGFPHQNTLTPTRTAISHHHPHALGSHPHPFSTPPPDLGSAYSIGNKQNKDSDVSAAETFVVGQQDEQQKCEDTDQHNFSNDHNRKHQPFSTTSTAFDVRSPIVHAPKLSTEPSSDIEYDRSWVPHASSRSKNPKLFTNTSLSTIPSSTRDTPDRMSSSTANSIGTNRKRAGSFAKFTITGPKVNLTGTPRGSGMREVGSSEADNSSPGMRFSSSPGIRFSSSPFSPKSNRSFHPIEDDQPENADYDEKNYATPASSPPNSAGLPGDSIPKKPDFTTSGSRNRFPVSPSVSIPRNCHFTSNSFSSSSISSSDTADDSQTNEGGYRKYQHLRAPSQKWAPMYGNYQRPTPDEIPAEYPKRKGSRRSVHSQKGLMPMRLSIIPQNRAGDEDVERAVRRPAPAEIAQLTRSSPHLTDIRPPSASVVGSTTTEAPLLIGPLRYDPVRVRPSMVESPSLKPLPLPPSLVAERRPREKLISWIVFMICVFFPPALIMYGFGWMDSLMAAATKGEFLGFGVKEKRFARYVGITMTVGTVVGIAAFMVSIAVKW